jgi:hypothetical protein
MRFVEIIKKNMINGLCEIRLGVGAITLGYKDIKGITSQH